MDDSGSTGPAAVRAGLEGAGSLADGAIATVVHLAERLAKRLLVAGPARVGKPELAKAISTPRGMPLVRLQCYEGVGGTEALYEWNYEKRRLRIQPGQGDSWDELSDD